MFCSSCGKQTEGKPKFCPFCGEKIIYNEPRPESAPQPTQGGTGEYWKCAACGEFLHVSQNSCGCGYKRPSHSANHQWRCSSCGNFVSTDVCPFCNSLSQEPHQVGTCQNCGKKFVARKSAILSFSKHHCRPCDG